MKFFSDSIFYSYAQIFFSNRRWFGILIIIASFVTPQIGLMALLGVALSNAVAILLRFDSEKIRSGFYGFNGILFGAGASFYFNVDLFLLSLILIFIIITFFISAVLENHMAVTFNLPGLSMPFIISLYIFIIFLSNYDFIKPAFFGSSNELIPSSIPAYVSDYLRSLSLIIFQPNVASGFIIAVALFLFSRVLFLLSIFSFALCHFYLDLILPGMHSDYLILFGFNSILTAFALGGSLIIPSRKSFLLVIISVLMVVIITGFFIRLFAEINLPVFVLPFNFIVLSTIYSLKFRKENTDLTLLYFKPGSPEENFYYHQRRRARFDKFKFIFPELPFLGEWFVSQGFNGKHTHKEDWKYAWDFVVKDDNGNECSNGGEELRDYYCFKLPVATPLEGEVVKVVDGIPNNKIGDVDLKKNWGNTIILKHEYDLFSALSHLESGSIKINEGDKVKKGQLIAECGSSGRSPIPHLHFQYQVTDKLGDKTFKFPFAHYLEKK
ncbi:MAG TPA: urea transporter, partial [Ignavibacteriaceae bacterium]|nr:urea transporter [Ignavibacteriaceae bacterium]